MTWSSSLISRSSVSSRSRGLVPSSTLARRTRSSSGISSKTGLDYMLTQRRRQDVVEVFAGARTLATAPVLERPLHRRDILPGIEQAEEPVSRDRALALLLETPRQDGVLADATLLEQVVAQTQQFEMTRALLERHLFESPPRRRSARAVEMQSADGGQGLVANEAIRIRQRANQDVHGFLGWDQGDGGREVPPDPDVFLG